MYICHTFIDSVHSTPKDLEGRGELVKVRFSYNDIAKVRFNHVLRHTFWPRVTSRVLTK